MDDKLIRRWKGRLSGMLKRRKRNRILEAKHRRRKNALTRAIAKLRGTIRRRRQAIATTPGERAADYLLRFVGRTESPPGSNDAPFLAQWRAGLPSLAWMRGQPWCGFAVIAAYHYGAKKRLPDGVVYTPNIVNWTRNGDGFSLVRPEAAKKGDLVVFDFPGGSGVADHVGLALGSAHNGYIWCVEGNTSFDNSGSQSNGGAVARRHRPLSSVAVVCRPD